jgi:hypothetical protein
VHEGSAGEAHSMPSTLHGGAPECSLSREMACSTLWLSTYSSIRLVRHRGQWPGRKVVFAACCAGAGQRERCGACGICNRVLKVCLKGCMRGQVFHHLRNGALCEDSR